MHAGGMTTSFLPHEHQLATLKTERDVIAAAVHLLGYWPQNSLVMLTTDLESAGPLLRVDLADPKHDATDAYIGAFLDALPPISPRGLPLNHLFVLLFSENSSAPQALHQRPKATPVTRSITLDSQNFIDRASHFIQPIITETAQRHQTLFDVIAVGENSYWSLNPAEHSLDFAGPISDVLMSPVYSQFIVNGSTLAPDISSIARAHQKTLQNTQQPETRHTWEKAVTSATYTYLARKIDLNPHEYFQLAADLEVWDTMLEKVHQELTSDLSEEGKLSLGDRLRERIPQHIAGYLLASLNSTATLNFLLYLAVRNFRQTQEALGAVFIDSHSVLTAAGQKPQRVLLPTDQLNALGLGHQMKQTLDHIMHTEKTNPEAGEQLAYTLYGAVSEPPNWQRLEALEYLTALLEPAAEDKPAALLGALQAWAKWFRGKSSEAFCLLDQSDPEIFEITPILLHQLLQAGALPLWLSEPGYLPTDI